MFLLYFTLQPQNNGLDQKIVISSIDLQFFDYIAECVEMFKTAIKKQNEEFSLGFCFGFPTEIQGLNKGILTQWAKRFHVSGVIGKDVVALLQEALDKKQVRFHLKLVINFAKLKFLVKLPIYLYSSKHKYYKQ